MATLRGRPYALNIVACWRASHPAKRLDGRPTVRHNPAMHEPRPRPVSGIPLGALGCGGETAIQAGDSGILSSGSVAVRLLLHHGRVAPRLAVGRRRVSSRIWTGWWRRSLSMGAIGGAQSCPSPDISHARRRTGLLCERPCITGLSLQRPNACHNHSA